MESIVADPDQLIDTVESRVWDNQLETASVAERVLKKIADDWRYTVAPYDAMPGYWAVRFKKA